MSMKKTLYSALSLSACIFLIGCSASQKKFFAAGLESPNTPEGVSTQNEEIMEGFEEAPSPRDTTIEELTNIEPVRSGHPALLHRSMTNSRQYKPLPDQNPLPVKLYDDPKSSVNHANASSLHHPASQSFFNSMMVYNYVDNALYTIYTAPGRVTTLNLEKGEKIQGVAAGDTASWMIEEITVPQGNKVFIKPYQSGLKTNIVLTTNQRSYYLEVESFEDTYMSSVSWTYPHSSIFNSMKSNDSGGKKGNSLFSRKAEEKEEPRVIETKVNISNLNFGYAIKNKKGKPRWTPIRAFDDGKKTFIEFDKSLSTTDAPVLFLTGQKKKQNQLVNYRVKYPYYIVDRLFDRATLHLDRHIVEIKRTK